MDYFMMLFGGLLIGLVVGVGVMEGNYRDAAVVSMQECTINKPSGTICVYEGSYIAKEIK